MGDSTEDDKRTRILDAALAKFSAYGLARTSMADIAEGAGMSRPAVYQYYANKDEIFAAMLGRILDLAADRAVAELRRAGELAEQLDGFLQRWYGDLTEQVYDTVHGEDIVAAKVGHAKTVSEQANSRVRKAVLERIGEALGAPRTRADVVDLADLLLLAPIGFKYDVPPIAKLRRRLTALARTVADAAAPAA